MDDIEVQEEQDEPPTVYFNDNEKEELEDDSSSLNVLLTKAGDIKSNPGPMTHTNKHTPVIWI